MGAAMYAAAWNLHAGLRAQTSAPRSIAPRPHPAQDSLLSATIHPYM